MLYKILLLLLLAPVTALAQWNLVAPNLLGNQSTEMGCIIHKSGIVWAGSHEVWMSPDSGLTWSKRSPNIGYPGDYISDVNFYDNMIGIVSTHGGNIYKTTDQGMTWTALPKRSGSHNAVFLSSPDHILVSTGAGGSVDVTNDGGLTWSVAKLGTLVMFVKPLLGGSAYAIGGSLSLGMGPLYIFKTTDYGTSWTQQAGQIDFDTWSFEVNPCEPNRIYAVNEGCNNNLDKFAELFISSDAGNSWTVTDSHPISKNVIQYYCGSISLSSKALFIQSINDGIIRSTDKGASWQKIGGPNNTYDTRLVAAINPNIILAADINGSIYRTINSGNDSLTNVSPYVDLSIQPFEVFTTDTLANCDTPVVRKIIFNSQLCSQPKIDTQFVIGADSLDYAIVKGITDSLSSSDTILVSFRPRSSGPQKGYYVLVLKDGTRFYVSLKGFGKGITFVEPSTEYVSVDTIGGTANVPIKLNGFPIAESIELVVHYDQRMQYIGSYALDGTPLDLPNEQWSGRAKIRIDAAEFQLDTNSGFARFIVFPDGEDCFNVSLDSLDILNSAAPCLYSIGNAQAKYVCPPRGCGIMTITNYMLHNVFPQLFIQPNPSHGTFTITSSQPIGESTLILYDELGRTTATTQHHITKGENTISFDHLHSGTYYLQIRSANKQTTVPLLIIE